MLFLRFTETVWNLIYLYSILNGNKPNNRKIWLNQFLLLSLDYPKFNHLNKISILKKKTKKFSKANKFQ